MQDRCAFVPAWERLRCSQDAIMVKKSKSKVVVDEASEEDDVCWQQERGEKVRLGWVTKEV